MANFAHAAHPNQHYLMVRADVAAQGHQHMSFTIELLARLAKRITASAAAMLQRWAAAHRQSVRDRMFWELAVTDRRMMAELQALKDYADTGGTA